MNISDKISAAIPGTQFSSQDTFEQETLICPPESLFALAELLKEDSELSFDFLRCMTGIDRGEMGFGVVYHLESSLHKHTLILQTTTTDRVNPELPSVCSVWKTAELNEREVYDFFGINFTNHPDMRRLFLRRDDWVGHPLRKDYNMSREINPLRMSNESAMDTTSTFTTDEEGKVTKHTTILFEEDEYVINIGPQHPATHGVLRFRVSLEGEIIKKLNVYCGYIHRGIEKICEGLTYPQIAAYTERLDYLSAMQNRHAFCMCVEKGLQVEIPERVQYIRTIMDELQRINSHLLFFSTLCMDLGALTAFFYGFRDREKILDILEETTDRKSTRLNSSH